MLKNINRRFFLKKTIYSFTSFIFLSNFLVLFLKKKNNIKLDNLTDNYFFALEKYRIETVNEINTKIENYAKNTNSKYGTGGMATKIAAAKICLLAGCYMAITNGNSNNPINKLYQKKNCTWFIPKISKLDARKKWIIGSVSPKGEIIIDDGAIKAIKIGKSLLPAGVKQIIGNFEKGDHILLKDQNGLNFGRGLVSFSSNEVNKIKGLHSNKIEKVLGYSSKIEIVHKDNLVEL